MSLNNSRRAERLPLPVNHTQGIPVYRPGRPIAELCRELGFEADSVLKLASNENVLAPSPAVRRAIRAAINEINLYPEDNVFLLRNELVQRLGVGADQLVFGAGLTDLIGMLTRAYCGCGDTTITADVTYAMYFIATLQTGGTLLRVPVDQDKYSYDLPAICTQARQVSPKIIYLANPNNPTGTIFTNKELEKLLKQVDSSTLIVVDEAYGEFVSPEARESYPDSLALQKQYPNLVVLRSFSKAYSLAGLRIGYGVCHPDIVQAINSQRAPFNISTLAQVAAVAALRDTQHLHRSQQLVWNGKRQIATGLNNIKSRLFGTAYYFNWVPTQANCVFFHFPELEPAQVNKIVDQLMSEKIIVRYLKPSN